MTLAAFLMLAQVSLTPAVLVDDLTERYGYGVVGTSVSAMPMMTVPNLENVVELDVRLKSRWRLIRSTAMPGVFRPEVAPYHEVFVEAGVGLPVVTKYSKVPETTRTVGTKISSGPRLKPLPLVSLEDLHRKGGAMISIDRLAELLGVDPERMPWGYRLRTARVRLDPKRPVDPMSLLAALGGGRIEVNPYAPPEASHRRYMEVDEPCMRSLAVATIRHERLQGERDPVDEGFSRFEKERPTLLAQGEEGFLNAKDRYVRFYFHNGGEIEVPVPDLERRIPGTLQRWANTYRDKRRGAAKSGSTLDVILRDPKPMILLPPMHGLGFVGYRFETRTISFLYDYSSN